MSLRRFFPSTIRINGGGDFEPEYQAVLDRATVLGYTIPDSVTNERNNQRVKNLKDIGVWQIFDLFYIFDNPSGLADFSKINYISPSNFELFNTNPALEPDFIPNSGFKGDGTKWFNTNFKMVTDANNISAESSGFLMHGFDFNLGIPNGFIFGARNVNSGDTQELTIATISGSLLRFRLKSTQGQTNNSELNMVNDAFSMCTNGISDARFNTASSGGINFIAGQNSGNFRDLDLYIFSTNTNNVSELPTEGGLKYFAAGSSFYVFRELVYSIMKDTYTP